jgi:predicted O-methyltransferase YrrM
MNTLIQKIYETRSVVGRSGNVHPLHSEIDHEEGKFLFELIEDDPSIVKTLEVGCAYGLSSLHICQALQDRSGASHTIIDPFQNTSWDGVGIKNLEEAGVSFFELIEMKSEFALPRLLEDSEGGFDFIFVDGWHTFDHTLIDCFYATRLLRVGGYLVIDDVVLPAVRRVVDFLSHYPCYEIARSLSATKPASWKRSLARGLLFPIPQWLLTKFMARHVYTRITETKATRMVALRKVSEDTRNWDWHHDVF